MRTSLQYLEAVRTRCGLTSDYQLAKLLELTPQQISRYRRLGDVLSDYTAVKVARLLELEPLEVIAQINAERAARAKRTEEQRFWEKLAKTAAGVAAVVLVAVSGLAYLPELQAGASALDWTDLYIMRSPLPGMPVPGALAALAVAAALCLTLTPVLRPGNRL